MSVYTVVAAVVAHNVRRWGTDMTVYMVVAKNIRHGSCDGHPTSGSPDL